MIHKRNVVYCHSIEYLTIPVNGEPSSANHSISGNQFWCKIFLIKDILNDIGDWNSTNDYIQGQHPFFFELTA